MPVWPFLIPVLAQDAPAVPDAGPAPNPIWQLVFTFGPIALIFYFLILRPQQKQEKQRRSMLDALKKKDRVLTSGGILGMVADLRDDEVTLRISENPDVKVRVRRSSEVEVLGDPAAAEGAAK